MATLYCDRCGSEIFKQEDGDWYCPECDCYYYIPQDREKYYTDPLFYTHETDANDSSLSIPNGCRACGNPAYPECINSCPLYDD